MKGQPFSQCGRKGFIVGLAFVACDQGETGRQSGRNAVALDGHFAAVQCRCNQGRLVRLEPLGGAEDQNPVVGSREDTLLEHGAARAEGCGHIEPPSSLSAAT